MTERRPLDHAAFEDPSRDYGILPFWFLNGELADYKRPARIALVDTLPRNENGKVVPAKVRVLLERQAAEVAQQ